MNIISILSSFVTYYILPAVVLFYALKFITVRVSLKYKYTYSISDMSGARLAIILTRNIADCDSNDTDLTILRSTDKIIKSFNLSNSFSPKSKIISLTPEVYDLNSIWAHAVAAHEATHAIEYLIDPDNQYKQMIFEKTLSLKSAPILALSVIAWIVIMCFQLESLCIIPFAGVIISILVLLEEFIGELKVSLHAVRLLKEQNLLPINEIRIIKQILVIMALSYLQSLPSNDNSIVIEPDEHTEDTEYEE